MSMNAIAFTKPGDEQVLELLQVPRPTHGAEDVLIKIHGFAINPVDNTIRNGFFAAYKLSEINIIGWDGSGVIEAVGSSVTSLKVGDEVFFSGTMSRAGAYAEYIALPQHLVALKPKTVDHVVAASMPLTMLTALQAIEARLNLRIPKTDAEIKAAASKSILITAGAGGVGSIAVQLAKRVYKIGTVITTASRPESVAWCKDQGADIVIDRSKDWKAQLEENGIKSIGLFLFCSKMEGLESTIFSLASYGAIIAGVARTQGAFPLAEQMAKAITIGFLHMLPIGHDRDLAMLASLIDDGTIKPWIGKKYDTATVENVREGHKALSTGATIGKISYAAKFE